MQGKDKQTDIRIIKFSTTSWQRKNQARTVQEHAN